MILVTGATGNIGSALLRQLHAHGAGPVRGLTRNPARASFPAGVEAVEGDLTRPDTLHAALKGVRAMVLLSGTSTAAGSAAEDGVLTAAREAGVDHVVLVSSIAVQTHPHLACYASIHAAERAVRDSGMDWTILRPTQFASNTLWWAPSVREHGTVRAPFADTGLPVIDPADIAAVARVVLTGPGHRGRTYALTGPETVTPRRQAAALAAALGREVTFTEISREEAHRDLAAVLGDATAADVLDLMGGDVNEELLAVRDTVRELTGVPARTFEEWAREHAAAFR
ncbi:NmrA family transcriptional regulator [Streptomyces mashuensis]|uniref:NmrA family transcriptional regulator n=1 Tax=Streptomyces mashuensis TaxID=33904 RepID=A0A919EFS4_9ACTN|nr:NAD(P)H-binding protein [Streptomyces mashuensis]GHF67455.1 NmrA family transcriptional regulator [Streptomyces mashuensis]